VEEDEPGACWRTLPKDLSSLGHQSPLTF
jgi:hypothetical protein